MIWLIGLVIWIVIGSLYIRVGPSDGIDLEKLKKLNLYEVLNFLVVLPVIIVISIIAYLAAIIAIQFNWYNTNIKEFFEIFFRFIPNNFKIRFFNKVIQDYNNGYGNFHLRKFLGKTPKKLQHIIVDWHIDTNIRLDFYDFELIKDTHLQWKYIDSMSKHRELDNWESYWLTKFIADERDRKIDLILND